MSDEAPKPEAEAPTPVEEPSSLEQKNILQKAGNAVGEVFQRLKTSGNAGDGQQMEQDVTAAAVSGGGDRRSTIRRRSIFLSVPPPKSNVHLKLHEDLFEHTNTGQDIPIGSVEGTPFYNLQIRGKLFDGNEIVLEDGATSANNKVVAVIERKYTTVGYSYRLYSHRQIVKNQEPSDLLKYETTLYDYAMVNQDGDKDGVLNVIREGEKAPKYTLETLKTKDKKKQHVIKKLGTTVATLSPSDGEFYQLDLEEGVDPCLLICLAAIADEVSKQNF